MNLILKDAKTRWTLEKGKSIFSLSEIECVLSQLGYESNKTFYLSQITNNEKINGLGVGVSFKCECEDGTSFRLGKYDDGESKFLQVSSDLKIDEYEFESDGKNIKLSKTGMTLSISDNCTISILYYASCVRYRFEKNGYTLECDFDMKVPSNKDIASKEQELLNYFKNLKLPLIGAVSDENESIFGVYSTISNDLGLSLTRLEVFSDNNSTCKIEFGENPDYYEVIATNGMEVVSCTKNQATFTKPFTAERDGKELADTIKCVQVHETITENEGKIITCSYDKSPKSLSSDVLRFESSEYRTWCKKGVDWIGQIRSFMLPYLEKHSAYVRTLK